ncbi:TPA: acyltransferase family protein [Escherichia coli]|uniref:acyltransferase family protein n=1 Tax=Escherichia coli TaxID=562 RepID=UPI001594C151|nr:acyltransferase [Escherichia coli]EFB7179141.1 acyltransferase [Escherichia coli]EGK2826150.1 acyltransferase [Escherichia coli]EJC7885404.1 acyltransferase [Escherichia coli]EKD0220488.1 acyltransferase [Escherichia coli]EKO9875622.1 acyltransferase [Escherichia coli]
MIYNNKPLQANLLHAKRNTQLDGIRGIAALSVALFHFFRAFDNSFISGEKYINHSFISTFWNGHFAVALFFVLSGYIFFQKFYKSNLRNGLKACIKRFLRLSMPIFIVCLIAFLFHFFNLFTNTAAASLSGSDWLGKWYQFSPSLTLAIKESFWTDFISFNPSLTYNSNLWTISYELFAVILVIFLAVFCKTINKKAQALLLITAAIACFNTHFFEFILGALLALLLRTKKINTSLPIAVITLIFSLVMASLYLPSQFATLSSNLFYPISAMLLIFTANTNMKIASVFSNKFFLKLGELSFGLYLTHFIVVNSLASTTFIYTKSIPLTLISYITCTIIFSVIFTHLVDSPWTRFLESFFREKNKRPEVIQN